MFLNKCRVCDASKRKIKFICNTYNEHSKTRSLSNFKCFTCGSVFINNYIDDDELAVAYSSFDDDEYYNEIIKTNTEKMKKIVNNFRKKIFNNSKILDIGSGSGLLLKLLFEVGFRNLYAHEIPGSNLSNLSRFAKEVYCDFNYQSIPEDNFDVVVLLDVLEHVRNPSFLLENCVRILKKDGLLYFHTPVVTRLDHLMHGLPRYNSFQKIVQTWQRSRTSIFHLQNFTYESLRILLEKNNLLIVDISITNELTWPVERYIEIYLDQRKIPPLYASNLIRPIVKLLINTEFMNANKAIVQCVKA